MSGGATGMSPTGGVKTATAASGGGGGLALAAGTGAGAPGVPLNQRQCRAMGALTTWYVRCPGHGKRRLSVLILLRLPPLPPPLPALLTPAPQIPLPGPPPLPHPLP